MKLQDYLTQLYHPTSAVLNKKEGCYQYHLTTDEGAGETTIYAVLEGVSLFYHDFSVKKVLHNKFSKKPFVEINYCHAGRFESQYDSDNVVYLTENDISISRLDRRTHDSYFPLGAYQGISLLLYLPQAQQSLDAVQVEPGFSLTFFDALLASRANAVVFPASPLLKELFCSLYSNAAVSWKRLASLAILGELSHLFITQDFDITTPYYPRARVETIKEVERFITTHIDVNHTQHELSRKFNIPLTTLKTTFKGVYGKPIFQYLQQYRMGVAASLLTTSELSILNIASQVGYQNPSNFSDVFLQWQGQLPLNYRKEWSGKAVTHNYETIT